MPAFQSLKQFRRKNRLKEDAKAEEDYARVQATRPWVCKTSIPWRLAQHTFLVKLAFLLFVLLITVLLFREPRTFIKNKEGNTLPVCLPLWL